jgi:1,4-dihydroxy-2-naphthoate octaprenyltransferase
VPGLTRPIGLGLAARGDVKDVVSWASEARDRGLDSVWFHDSYFERDAVTYASAVASQVGDIRIALGALNPNTRHPVLLAMTVSALDEMAPGRIILGLGTGLPLRLAQMDIPYSPDDAVQDITRTIEVLKTLWAGDRITPETPGVPPLQPMFPPVHEVPVFVAAYRSDMVRMAGRVADGYMARPAESLVNYRRILNILRDASQEAGRPRDTVTTQGYLLSLTGSSRREALNRAKREPFVIYMMSIQSEFALTQAGFDPAIRQPLSAAWREERYHDAAEMIPDEMIDAFLLCGTPQEVAAKAWEFHEAGMDIPVLQPVVQENEQARSMMEAAVHYGSTEGLSPAVSQSRRPTEPERARTRLGERLGGWAEVVRPFSFTASVVPIAAGGALAAAGDGFSWPLFAIALVAGVLLHIGTNVINEIYDVREGIDSIVSPRASHAIVKGRVTERDAFRLAAAAFVLATACGVLLLIERGWPIVALGLLGLAGGFGYTAPPFEYKYKGLGVPFVFFLMGPLMVEGAYFASSGRFSWTAVVLSVPIGLLVAAILHGNEWRDISEDARAGVRSLSIVFGRRVAHLAYVALILGAYLSLTLAVLAGALPTWSLLATLSLPLLIGIISSSELGASGQQRAIAMIDLQTARLHAVFGALLVAGLVIAAAR